MEYAEYYRIIRQRIWIVILFAVLPVALVAVGTVLLPSSNKLYSATVLLQASNAAMERASLDGDTLRVGFPPGDRTDAIKAFWDDFAQYAQGQGLDQIASSLQLSGAEAKGGGPLTVKPQGSTDTAQLKVDASAKPVATKLAGSAAAVLDQGWRQYKMNAAAGVQQQLRESLALVTQTLPQLAQQMGALTQKYGGVAPTDYQNDLTTQLAAAQDRLIVSEEEATSSRERASVLVGAETTRPAPTTGLAPAAAAVSPRMAALQAKILDKQLQIDQELTRRKPTHPTVIALQAELKRMQDRAAQVQREEVAQAHTGPTQRPQPVVDEAVRRDYLTAAATAKAMEASIGFLSGRAAEIRRALPTVRADADQYKWMQADMDSRKQKISALQRGLADLDAAQKIWAKTPMILAVSQPEAKTQLRRVATRLVGALLVGLIIGLLVVFMTHYVDSSFANEEQAEQLLGERVLVGIPRSDMQVEPDIPSNSSS